MVLQIVLRPKPISTHLVMDLTSEFDGRCAIHSRTSPQVVEASAAAFIAFGVGAFGLTEPKLNAASAS